MSDVITYLAYVTSPHSTDVLKAKLLLDTRKKKTKLNSLLVDLSVYRGTDSLSFGGGRTRLPTLDSLMSAFLGAKCDNAFSRFSNSKHSAKFNCCFLFGTVSHSQEQTAPRDSLSSNAAKFAFCNVISLHFSSEQLAVNLFVRVNKRIEEPREELSRGESNFSVITVLAVNSTRER